jgi:hypothetical protein
MPFPLLQLPPELLPQIAGWLSYPSRLSLALALAGRPREGDSVSADHVRRLQEQLLPTDICLYIDEAVEDMPKRERA